MNHALLDTTKIIRKLEVDGTPYEVCAEAVATHDRHTNQLTVSLSTFLRSEKNDQLGTTITPSWLPPTQVVKEHVEKDEAHEAADDVFRSWCEKVAGSLPR